MCSRASIAPHSRPPRSRKCTLRCFDLIGFVLFLIFVLVSSVIMLTRVNAVPNTAGGPRGDLAPDESLSAGTRSYRTAEPLRRKTAIRGATNPGVVLRSDRAKHSLVLLRSKGATWRNANGSSARLGTRGACCTVGLLQRRARNELGRPTVCSRNAALLFEPGCYPVTTGSYGSGATVLPRCPVMHQPQRRGGTR